MLLCLILGLIIMCTNLPPSLPRYKWEAHTCSDRSCRILIMRHTPRMRVVFLFLPILGTLFLMLMITLEYLEFGQLHITSYCISRDSFNIFFFYKVYKIRPLLFVRALKGKSAKLPIKNTILDLFLGSQADFRKCFHSICFENERRQFIHFYNITCQ